MSRNASASTGGLGRGWVVRLHHHAAARLVAACANAQCWPASKRVKEPMLPAAGLPCTATCRAAHCHHHTAAALSNRRLLSRACCRRAATHPPSMGLPEPLKMRPSMSRDTGVLSTCWCHCVETVSGRMQTSYKELRTHAERVHCVFACIRVLCAHAQCTHGCMRTVLVQMEAQEHIPQHNAGAAPRR